jgi:hypothetical protein
LPTPQRIFVLTGVPPDPDASSAQRRVFRLLGLLLEAGHRVEMYAVLGREPCAALARLGEGGRFVLHRALSVAPGQAPFEIDLLYATNLWTVPVLTEALRILGILLAATARRPALVFDSMDCLYRSKGPFVPPQELFELTALEALFRRLADLSVLMSEEEAGHAARRFHLPANGTFALGNVHDPAPGARALGFGERRHLCFVGAAHGANVEAIEHFLRFIFPRILEQLPEIDFHVIGRELAGLQLRGFAPAVVARTRVVGAVDDIEATVARYRAQVVPLLNGAGVKGKILESMACGTPVVTTTRGIEGMGAVRDGVELLWDDDPGRFAEKTVRLCTDPARWEALQDAGLAWIEQNTGSAVMRRRLDRLLERIAAIPRE